MEKREGCQNISIRARKQIPKPAHIGRLVGSALLNIWEYCHRTVEVHRANELEPLSTSGERTLCRLFARSKPGWGPRARNGSDSFQNVRLTIRHNQSSTVASTVGERTEITARSRSEIDCLFDSHIRYFSYRFLRPRLLLRA